MLNEWDTILYPHNTLSWENLGYPTWKSSIHNVMRKQQKNGLFYRIVQQPPRRHSENSDSRSLTVKLEIFLLCQDPGGRHKHDLVVPDDLLFFMASQTLPLLVPWLCPFSPGNLRGCVLILRLIFLEIVPGSLNAPLCSPARVTSLTAAPSGSRGAAAVSSSYLCSVIIMSPGQVFGSLPRETHSNAYQAIAA